MRRNPKSKIRNHKGHLALKTVEPVPPDVVVQDNRISAPGFTFVIQVSPASPMPA